MNKFQESFYRHLKFINHLAYFLNYGSKSRYNTEESQGRKLMILSKFQVHKERSSRTIEQLGLRKTCSKCGKELPTTTRFYYKDCNTKDGLRNDCRQCHKATQKELYDQKRKCPKDITPVEDEEFSKEEYLKILFRSNIGENYNISSLSKINNKKNHRKKLNLHAALWYK